MVNKSKVIIYFLSIIFLVMPAQAYAKNVNKNILVTYQDIKVFVNNKALMTNKAPFIYDGTTYLPLRSVAEASDMNVAWDEEKKVVRLNSGEKSRLGNKETLSDLNAKTGSYNIPVTYCNISIVINGKKLITDQEPFIYKDTTYLPLRAVAEAVGLDVKWDQKTKTVWLSDGNKTEQGKTKSTNQILKESKLPQYWTEYLEGEINKIKEKQKDNENTFSFVAMTDIHEQTNPGKKTGIIANAIMESCDIKYSLVLGDVVIRNAAKNEMLMVNSFANAEKILNPIRDKVLQVEGNHDGAWGNDETGAFTRRLSREKMQRRIYDKVKQVDGVKFADCGYVYYADDKENRVRYIMLNTHYYDEQLKSDGTVVNNPFRISRFGQAQYDFLVDEALIVPEGWSIIVAGHVAISSEGYPTAWWRDSGDNELMRRMLVAYNNRQIFNDGIKGTTGSDAVNIQADFREEKGNVIAYFAGHDHVDSVKKEDGLTIVNVRSDAHEENVDGKAETVADDLLRAERISGTVTEHSFDVVTVNTKTRTIYLTKIGAGKDRTIKY